MAVTVIFGWAHMDGSTSENSEIQISLNLSGGISSQLFVGRENFLLLGYTGKNSSEASGLI